MISRRSALLVAEGYKLNFRRYEGSSRGYKQEPEELYLFLFEREYEAWFCNLARLCKYQNSIFEFVATLHTGESIVKATPNWTWPDRCKAGKKLLVRMAQDYLNAYNKIWFAQLHPYESQSQKDQREHYGKLTPSLELDGYVYRDSKLFYSESEVLDVQEEHGILSQLYGELNLNDRDVAMHHLKLSESHYISRKWDDAISNSRKFLECVLMQVAAEHSRAILKTDLPEKKLERPVEVRDYLEQNQMLDSKEKEAFSKVYGLLSHTGSHPNMAEKDQARLLRQLALTLSQFIMLRLIGILKRAKS